VVGGIGVNVIFDGGPGCALVAAAPNQGIVVGEVIIHARYINGSLRIHRYGVGLGNMVADNLKVIHRLPGLGEGGVSE